LFFAWALLAHGAAITVSNTHARAYPQHRGSSGVDTETAPDSHARMVNQLQHGRPSLP
jgi:hypothetical protein